MKPNRFKFRAWDKKDEQMSSNWCALNILMNEDEKNENKIIMQSTGLSDINGKEIFVGDILATSNSNPKHDTWDKEELGYTEVIEDEEMLGVNFSKWRVDCLDKDSVYFIGFVEIIGNKFETPELIN